MKSIRTKFSVLLGILLIIVCLGLSGISYYTSTKALYEVCEELTTKTAMESARVVEERINGRFSELLAIANTEKIISSDISIDEKIDYLEGEAKRGGYFSLGLGGLDGKTLTMDGSLINLRDREYYKKALNGSPAVSDPIINREDNATLIVNYAVPITNEKGEIIGILIGSRNGDELSEITNDILLGETGRAYMINSQGIAVAHYDQEQVRMAVNMIEMHEGDESLRELSKIAERMIVEESGFGEYSYNNAERFVAFSDVVGTDWTLAIAVPKIEILSSLNILRNSNIFTSATFLLIGLTAVYFITGSFAKQIKGISNSLEVVASGDFTLDNANEIKGEDEIASVYNSMAIMKKSVNNMIQGIRDAAMVIHKDSENLSLIAEGMTSTSENVSIATQDTAQGIADQALELSNINMALDNFGEKLEGIVRDIEDMDRAAREVEDMSQKGNDDMRVLIGSVNVIEETFKDFTGKITILNQNILQINDITNVINGIAEQTNLLALNAAIEAARAGDAGKGFAVVAEEIRKLAEESQNSSHNISNLINDITKDGDMILQSTNELNDELDKEVDIINMTIENYRGIVEEINNIVDRIETVNSLAIEIDNEKASILSNVQDASAVAEEVSASSEEIAASSEEITASSQEVSSSAENLDMLINNMLKEVNKFKI